MLFLEFFVVLTLSFVARDSPNAELIRQMRKISEFASNPDFSDDVYEDATLDAPTLIQKYGYPCEIHKVITPDGYILEMHRIPHGRDKNTVGDPNKIPVFLMHGLVMSSADWVTNRPDKSLAYRLAELGYDVWMGNARGNYYSRAHIKMNPDKLFTHFWDFDWEQIGYTDLAAFIDRVQAVTKHSKIHYVGHSQVQALAPATFFIYNNLLPFTILGPFIDILEKFRFVGGEILGRSDKVRWIGANVCSDDAKLQPLCLSVPYIGKLLSKLNTTMIPTFLGHFPAGSSLRQLAHYGQSIKYKNFARYNYGFVGNLFRYGRLRAPDYDLSKISVPTYLYFGLGDEIVNPRDVLHLSTQLPNVKSIIKVARSNFGHFDFLWAPDTPTLVNDHVVRMLQLAEADMKLGISNTTSLT